MELNVQKFNTICRVCLTQSSELTSLFAKKDSDKRSLLEILSFTANLDIKIEDSLPKQICSDCETVMCKADAFKRRCMESETILNNVYQNAASCGESTNDVQNCLIKDEKSEFKQKLSEYGTFMCHIPTNSGHKESFDSKNILLHEFSIPAADDISITNYSAENVHSGQEAEQPVKEEDEVNFEEGGSFVDDFDHGNQFEIIPKEDTEKVKVENSNKKLAMRYQCYCNTQFTNKETYKTHLKQRKCDAFARITSKNPMQCTKCDQQFTTANSYKVHQRKEHNENTIDETDLFQCSLCLRKFKNKTSLAAHIQRHEVTDNIKHVCEICKREFKYKAYLENHILTTHSRTNGFTCEICAQNFTDKDTLETHKRTHENEKKHRCSVCSKAFLMLCTLKEHMRTHTGEKPFLCSQCGKGFSQKTNLAQHMRRHQGLKPFKCKICEKRFVSKGELDAHNRKHSGAHPFVCDECGNGFTTSSALVKHRRVHTGERPYQCDLCPMRFAASGTLKNHRRTHTGERPFQCSYCEKAFVQRNDLISHIRCHTGERPYICNQCGQSFRKASGMKSHLKLHIKDPIVGVNAAILSLHCSEQ